MQNKTNFKKSASTQLERIFNLLFLTFASAFAGQATIWIFKITMYLQNSFVNRFNIL